MLIIVRYHEEYESFLEKISDIYEEINVSNVIYLSEYPNNEISPVSQCRMKESRKWFNFSRNALV